MYNIIYKSIAAAYTHIENRFTKYFLNRKLKLIVDWISSSPLNTRTNSNQVLKRTVISLTLSQYDLTTNVTTLLSHSRLI